MDTRKLRPDFSPQVVDREASLVEDLQEELLYLPTFADDLDTLLDTPHADVSWLELMLYWLGELSWWRAYWERNRN
jgi:hypothetical protein